MLPSLCQFMIGSDVISHMTLTGDVGTLDQSQYICRVSWNSLNANWLERTVIGRY